MQPQLAQIEEDIWAKLSAATADSTNPWRLPVLATTDTATPRVRTIVLRDVDRATRTLFLHTDVRSPKVRHIEKQNTVGLAFYDHSSGLQLVVHGLATVHTSESLADEHWSKTPASSRRAYLAPHTPGTPCESPSINLPAHVAGRVPTEEELKPARVNFAVLSVRVEHIDWLRLERDGNTRALFDYTASMPAATWIAP